MTKQLINDNVRFFKSNETFKGFHSTWLTVVMYEHKVATQIINQLKDHPYITGIQYYKRKRWGVNSLAVSFKTEAEEAAFVLLSNNGIPVKYEVDV